MSDSLTTLITRLRVLLQDVDGDIWSQGLLEECIRSALAEIQTVCPYPLTLSGLDDALETTLDQEIKLTPLLLQLAQQQALTQRQVERSETFHPDPTKQSTSMVQLLDRQGLREVMEKVRRYFLQRSTTSPY